VAPIFRTQTKTYEVPAPLSPGSATGAKSSSDVEISAELRARLERCSLPTLPAIALRVLELCQSDNIDLKQIADTLTKDPALSAKVLRLVNSPAFGLRQEVRTVPNALALLGLNAVRTLALSFSLVRDLKKSQTQGLDAYWKRSIISAVAGRELAVALRFPAPDEAFLASLLQDIGMLALGRVAGREYESVATKAGDNHRRLAELEREAFGSDHADIGAWMIANWHLPDPICQAVAWSHKTVSDFTVAKGQEDIQKLVKIVRLSGILADVWVCADAGAATEILKHEAPRTVGLAPDQIEPVLSRIATAIPQVASLFEIQLGTADEISAVLEEATETLVMVTMRASRQIDSAREAIDSLEQKARVLEEASLRDKLTGLFNRARFDTYLDEEFLASLRTGKPLSLLMGDVDHFKKVNDTKGHAAGDQVLIAVAKALGGRLRPRDLAARYGGEEFVLILPETDAPGALVVAERIRQKVEQTQHDLMDGSTIAVTISLGCATVGPATFPSAQMLLKAADEALYRAKHAGRNRVVSAGS